MNRYYVYCIKWKRAGAILSMFLLIVSSKFVDAQHIEPRNPENAFIPLQLTESTLNTVQNERLTVLQPTDLAKQPVFIELTDKPNHVFGSEERITTDGNIFKTGNQEDQLTIIPNRLKVAPNPFNSHTTLTFNMEQPVNMWIEVYDILGRRVAKLADGKFVKGAHEVLFGADHLASGTYLIHIRIQVIGEDSTGDVIAHTRVVSLIK